MPPQFLPSLRIVATLLLLAPLSAQNERPPEAFQIGLGLQQRGMQEEAARSFQEFLHGNPTHAMAPEAWYRLGSCQAELGKHDDAIASLQKSVQKDGMRFAAEARYRLGNCLKEQGKLEPAAQHYGKLCQAVAADHYLIAAARYAEGECRRDLKDDGKALAAFTAAAAASKGEQASFLFPALYQAGFAQLRLGDAGKATELFARAGAAAGDDAARTECHYLCGDAALRAKVIDRAERELQAAVKGGGEFADDARYDLGWCAIEKGDRSGALQAFRGLLQHHADSPLVPRARLEIGRLLFQDHKFADARTELDGLLQRDGLADDVRQQAQELSGLCALELGQGDAALTSLRAALAKAAASERPRLQYALGEALAGQKQWAEALPAYASVPADAAPELRGDALYGACFCLHQLGRYAESSQRAEQLRKDLPQHRLVVQAAFAVAENLFAEKKYQDADREYATVPAQHALASKAAWKRTWCSYLGGNQLAAAARFQELAGSGEAAFREEALAMAAIAWLEGGKADEALRAADLYRTRHAQGAFLARTERIAARVLRQRGDLSGASARLEHAAASANNKEASADLLEQAELQYQQGDYRAAQKIYDQLADAKDRTGARALEGLAWCVFELGDDAGCAELIARGLAHPQVGELEAELLELRSALHHRQQDWAAAVADAEQFLHQYGKHARAPAMRYSQGVALARSGEQVRARQVLAALAKDGGYERMDRVSYELAWACRRGNDEAAALQAFAAVAKDSKDPELAGEANLHLGVARLEQGDERAGRELLGKVEGKHKGRALYRLGFFDLEHCKDEPQRLARAKGAFAAIAQLPNEPLAAEATFLLGECCVRAADQRGAADAFQALLAADSKHERAQSARLQLGECCVALGHGDAAAAVLEEFLRGKPEDRTEQARAHLALGRARVLRGEHDKAEPSFAKVTELSEGPLAAEAQYRLGESRAARGDLNGAADAFVKLPILYAHEEWVRKGLLAAGRTYEQLQQPQKARRFYEELLRRFPASAESQDAQSRLRGV